MKIVITGASKGIGLAVAKRFLSGDNKVLGLDLLPSPIKNDNYTHYTCDVSKKRSLPEINGAEYIFINAGTQNKKDISNNLFGAINATEKYAFSPCVKSVLFNASASALSGSEFPEYAASKAGVLGYMRNVALRLALYGATANAICLGGVLTGSNSAVIEDKDCWDKIMELTPLKRWTTEEEVADWVEFLLIKNRSMTGEALLIDNGEFKLNTHFIWK